MAKSKPIVWGVDLSEKDPRDFRKMADIIGVWNHSRSDIIPLAILGPLKRTPTKLYTSLELTESASEHFNSLLHQVTTVGIKDLKVVFSRSGRHFTQTFLENAAKMKAEMVAVQTHSHRGFQRLYLGSFAESLIGSSNLPVFTVNPQTLVPAKISTVVYAAKLTGKPDRTFKQAIQWAKERKSHLVVCHKFEIPWLPGDFGEFGLVVDEKTNQLLVDDSLAGVRRQMKVWVQTAKKAGISCEGVVFNEPGRVAEGLLLTAQEHKADIIVMSTHIGPLGLKFLGSAAREVLMTSSCPVIVLHENRR